MSRDLEARDGFLNKRAVIKSESGCRVENGWGDESRVDILDKLYRYR